MSSSSPTTSSYPDSGIWIGIDLGTSNSTCAVWDSTRGRPKWIRLPKNIAHLEGSSKKLGRIMPSIVRIIVEKKNDNDDKSHQQTTLVGAEAETTTTTTSSSSSLLQSVKRLLGKKYEDLDPEWIQTLDYDILPPPPPSTRDNDDDDGSSIRLVARTSSSTTVELTPQDVLSSELKALRIGSQQYLNRFISKKKMKVPGNNEKKNHNNSSVAIVRNVVVGIPAHFSKRHIQLLEEACRQAGFDGHISTCLESTAAAMAYGLTMQEEIEDSPRSSNNNPSVVPTIMVIDMGGGTSDITIAHKQQQQQQQQ